VNVTLKNDRIQERQCLRRLTSNIFDWVELRTNFSTESIPYLSIWHDEVESERKSNRGCIRRAASLCQLDIINLLQQGLGIYDKLVEPEFGSSQRVFSSNEVC